jgi:hypothetical protein
MDRPIDVIWKSYHTPEIIGRGYWDNGLLEYIFSCGRYVHHDDYNWVGDRDGAVVILNGRTHVNDIAAINRDISKLRWVVFIDTGDEEANLPWQEIKHPMMRFWVMMPRMRQHDSASYYLPNGFRPNTRELLREIGYKDKPLDWFFCGQITHERREQMADIIKKMVGRRTYDNGLFVPTDHFGAEDMDYNRYLEVMSTTKIAFCPSGPESPDNFRLYEALECGCLPIVDSFSTNFRVPGFWNYLFDGDVPFPIINNWSELVSSGLIGSLLAGYPENANRCYAWWQLKKREIKLRLENDIKELSR